MCRQSMAINEIVHEAFRKQTTFIIYYVDIIDILFKHNKISKKKD